MSSKILQYFKLLSNNKIKITNHKLKKVIHGYSFIYISSEIKLETNEKVYQKMKESSIIIIKEYKEKNEEENDIQYFIIGFKQTLLIVKQESIQFIYKLLSCKPDLTICFLENSKEQFNKHIIIDYHEKVADHIFCKEISYFEREFVILPRNSFYKAIIPCIAGYLINNGYMKTFEDRLQAYSKRNIRTYEPDEFIFLKLIDSTLISQCSLYYNIEEEQLMVIKKHSLQDVDYHKLKAREIDNYENTSHPLIPTFFGTMEQDGQQSIIIEFINGQTLEKVEELGLSFDDLTTVIFELLMIIQYFHDRGLIYRDIKPNNIMIDEHKTVVMIDFDRLIDSGKENDNLDQTLDLNTDTYIAPEIFNGEVTKYSFKSDIYSLGKFVEYLINGTERNNDPKKVKYQAEYSIIKQIFIKCIDKKAENRPSISDLLVDFIIIFQQKIFIEGLFADYRIHFNYLNIFNNTNQPKIQNTIGNINYEFQYIMQFINKVFHFLSFDENKIDRKAQSDLGLIYQKSQ